MSPEIKTKSTFNLMQRSIAFENARSFSARRWGSLQAPIWQSEM
jgi:hypothetical protein